MKFLSRINSLWLVSICFIVPPFFIKNQYILHVLIMLELWVILGMSLDVIMGYTGQVSAAHGALFGIGAYSSALLCMRLGLSFWVSLPIAALLTIFLGVLIGIPSFRSTGVHFVIVTLGFGLVFSDIFMNWVKLTNGPMGLGNIPLPSPVLGVSFGSKKSYYYLAFIFMFFILCLMKWLSISRLGKAFIAIREDDVLAKSFGINVMKYKTIAMMISSLMAGLAGSLYAHYILFIDPATFTTMAALDMTFVIVVGGMGTFLGPIVGAIFMIILPELLRITAQSRMAIYGLILVFFIICLPGGIVGVLKGRLLKR